MSSRRKSTSGMRLYCSVSWSISATTTLMLVMSTVSGSVDRRSHGTEMTIASHTTDWISSAGGSFSR